MSAAHEPPPGGPHDPSTGPTPVPTKKAKPAPMALDDALALTFDSDAGDGLTVRGYLHQLLATLWHEQEGFSGKRPFGNSGWTYDLYVPLARAGAIKATLTPWGDAPDEVDLDMSEAQRKAAHAYVRKLIAHAMAVPR